MTTDVRLIIISGCSGSGKSTLMDNLRQQGGFSFLKTVTTRLPRDSDPVGDYDYISSEEFSRQVIAGKIILPTEVSGNHYGIYYQQFEEALNGDQVYVRSVTPNNFADYYQLAGEKVLFLYIELDDPERCINRMMKRGGMTNEAMLKRMQNERYWNEQVNQLIDQGLPIFKLTSIEPSKTLGEAQAALDFVRAELAEVKC